MVPSSKTVRLGIPVVDTKGRKRVGMIFVRDPVLLWWFSDEGRCILTLVRSHPHALAKGNLVDCCGITARKARVGALGFIGRLAVLCTEDGGPRRGPFGKNKTHRS